MGNLIVFNSGVVTEFVNGEEFFVEFAVLIFDFYKTVKQLQNEANQQLRK